MSSQETGWFFTDARFYGGFAAGVVVLVALGFNWVGDFGFGWKLGSTTQQLASQAVEERLAAVCVARAQQDPEAESVLAALRKETSWKQRGFVTERGWATILPSEAPDRGVAGRCAKLLAKPSI